MKILNYAFETYIEKLLRLERTESQRHCSSGSKEVEDIVQVALLCTQGSPEDRPWL